MTCEKCGQQNDDGSKFCISCGANMVAAETVQEAGAVLESTASTAQEGTPETPQATASEPIPDYSAPEPVSPVYTEPAKPDFTQKQREPDVQPVRVEKPVKITPLPVWKYIGIFLLTSIPILGFIMILVWSFGSSFNKNTKNFAIAVLILGIIFFILSIVGTIMYWDTMKYFIDNAYDLYSGY